MKINYEMSWDVVYDALIVVVPIMLIEELIWRIFLG